MTIPNMKIMKVILFFIVYWLMKSFAQQTFGNVNWFFVDQNEIDQQPTITYRNNEQIEHLPGAGSLKY